MDIKELKHFVQEKDNFEIRVISHAGSRLYRVDVEDVEGQHHPRTRGGKPMLFRALDDVYAELKRAGVHRAYLVQWVAHDEAIGREPNYQSPLTSRMPLVF